MRTDEQLKRLAAGWQGQEDCVRASYGCYPNCAILTNVPCFPTDPVCLDPDTGCASWAVVELLWRAGVVRGGHPDVRVLAQSIDNGMTRRYLRARFQHRQF